MKLFRNLEIRRNILFFIVVTGVATCIASMWDIKFGIFTCVFGMIIITMHIGTTARRYKRIAKLSELLNQILHGEDIGNELHSFSEGELSILQSEIYKMTVRLREQQKRLEDDKKYLADSIADISHQIRTPLTTMNLLVSILEDAQGDYKEQQIQALEKQLSRIDWLITTLLKISKLDAGTVIFKREEVSLDMLIQKAMIPLLVPIELREQKLKIKTEGTFVGDIAWTCEALGNIVKNCMEHTPYGGNIEIMAMENPIYTEIVIKDNGSGIAKEDLPHIFERFYKGKNATNTSFGIGLALARMIITSQNGTVRVKNQKEKGVQFTIHFYKEM